MALFNKNPNISIAVTTGVTVFNTAGDIATSGIDVESADVLKPQDKPENGKNVEIKSQDGASGNI